MTDTMTATLAGASTLSADGVGDVEAYNRDVLDLLLLYLARTPADAGSGCLLPGRSDSGGRKRRKRV